MGRRSDITATQGSTRGLILDAAELLIQTRGYNAFSYQDISDQLGLRKASIHYYFPSKSDLGLAVITRYSERMSQAMSPIAADADMATVRVFDLYCQPYLMFAETPDKVCLSAALAGEMPSLPQEIRAGVDAFFAFHHAWLQRILERGLARGDLRLTAPPAKMARTIFSALQGALLVKRTTGDMTQLQDVIDTIRAQLFDMPQN